MEAANGAAYFALARADGRRTPRTVVMMALVTALIVLSLIDLEWQILPNVITLPGIALGLLASLLPGPPSRSARSAAAAGGYLALMALALAWKRFRQRGRARPGRLEDDRDARARSSGWQGMLLTVFLASVLGTLVGRRRSCVFAGRTRQHRCPWGRSSGWPASPWCSWGTRSWPGTGGCLRG